MSKITFDDAKNFGEERRKQILSNFGEEDIMSKAISFKEFDEKYGSGHEVFTTQNLSDYIAKKTEGDNSDEMIKSIEGEFSDLEKVLVKGTDGVESRYIRKAVEAKEEVADENAEETAEESSEEKEDKEEAEEK